MNVAIINLKDLWKYAIKIIILIGTMLFLSNIFLGQKNSILKNLKIKYIDTSIILNYGTAILSPKEKSRSTKNSKNIIGLQIAMLTEFEPSELQKNNNDNKMIATETEIQPEQETTNQEINLPVIEKTDRKSVV